MTVFRTVLSTALLLGLALGGRASFAQAPSGSITNQIVGATNSLWDAKLLFPDLTNDTWAGDLSIFAARATNDAVSIGLSTPHSLDGHGKLKGSGTNEFSVSLQAEQGSFITNWINKVTTNSDGSFSTNQIPVVFTSWNWVEATNLGSFPGTYVTHGSVSGSKGIALVKFTSQESGYVPFSGATRHVSATKDIYVVVTTNNFAVFGSQANIVRFSGKPSYVAGGRFSAINPFYTYLGGGAWTLVLNFDAPTATGAATNRLSGDATVTLTSLNVYPFRFKGRYSPKTGLSTLLLTGVQNRSDTQDGRGSTLSVTLTNSQLFRFFGQVAGQSVSQK